MRSSIPPLVDAALVSFALVAPLTTIVPSRLAVTRRGTPSAFPTYLVSHSRGTRVSIAEGARLSIDFSGDSASSPYAPTTPRYRSQLTRLLKLGIQRHLMKTTYQLVDVGDAGVVEPNFRRLLKGAQVPA